MAAGSSYLDSRPQQSCKHTIHWVKYYTGTLQGWIQSHCSWCDSGGVNCYKQLKPVLDYVVEQLLRIKVAVLFKDINTFLQHIHRNYSKTVFLRLIPYEEYPRDWQRTLASRKSQEWSQMRCCFPSTHNWTTPPEVEFKLPVYCNNCTFPSLHEAEESRDERACLHKHLN